METGKILALVGMYYIFTKSHSARGDIYPPQVGSGSVEY